VATDRTGGVASKAVRSLQDARFEDATAAYGAALGRLARAYEPDPDQRQDLLQDILTALVNASTESDRVHVARERAHSKPPQRAQPAL
jgi:DNA-directed RNA polymerase specialized sigma24 family protein